MQEEALGFAFVYTAHIVQKEPIPSDHYYGAVTQARLPHDLPIQVLKIAKYRCTHQSKGNPDEIHRPLPLPAHWCHTCVVV